MTFKVGETVVWNVVDANGIRKPGTSNWTTALEGLVFIIRGIGVGGGGEGAWVTVRTESLTGNSYLQAGRDFEFTYRDDHETRRCPVKKRNLPKLTLKQMSP